MSEDEVVYYGLDDMYHSAVMTGFAVPATGTDIDTGETVLLVNHCGEWTQEP